MSLMKRARNLLFQRVSSLGESAEESVARKAIRQGGEARDRHDWGAAAAFYRAAVQAEPDLGPIWVQLAHALKESGDLVPAVQAYQEAINLDPADVETHVHLAHVFKNLGHIDSAIHHLLHALHMGLDARSEEQELLRLFGRAADAGSAAFFAQLPELMDRFAPRAGEARFLTRIRDIIAPAALPPGPDRADADQQACALVFDISDLVGYFANARLPTGIQRVQIEAIEGALSRPGSHEIRLCCFIDGREDWLEVPTRTMRHIARLATASGDRQDPEWVDAMAELHLHLRLSPPFEFPMGSALVNLGTSWWLQNYFLFVRQAKASRNIRYIPFVHDMIPIMAPDHCTRGLTQDFISWAIGVFDHADFFLANSQATMKDLVTVAGTLGYALEPDKLAVIPLDTDFRKAGAVDLPGSALNRWHLKPEGFVLFVSTIESRKGHMTAFDAWSDMIDRHGPEAVPQLVCVGNRGWLNDRIYKRIATDEALARKVTMLSRLSDAELALLYRTCRFTIYPSLYEGWGLPVTESLCYGKVPLISDVASLPEAGGRFAVYASAGSAASLAREAERLIFDDDRRKALEAEIVEHFRARSWGDLADQIVREIDRFLTNETAAGAPAEDAIPLAQIGAWHPMTRNSATRVWPGMRSNEGFRSDLGWYWPEERGCRVRSQGGELALRLEGPHAPLRLLFGLKGDDGMLCSWKIRCGETVDRGEIEPNASLWTWIDVPAADETHTLRIEFSAVRAADGNLATYFLRGFHVQEAHDLAARQDFVEALTLDRLDKLAAVRKVGPA